MRLFDRAYGEFNNFLERHFPSGLYQRALIILVAPMVVLQSIMTGVILDRHWDNVTRVLARALARDVGLLIDMYQNSDQGPAARQNIEALASRRLKLALQIQSGELPPPVNAPLFSLVDRRLAAYLNNDPDRPFWIDTVSHPGTVDIRVEAEKGVIFRVLTDENRVYAASTNTLLIWMVLSSLILLGIAVVFLRNQIRPILRLAVAAQNFGTGRSLEQYRPSGAEEVRRAGEAFLVMRERIAAHVEQRTAMLAGVSHDLRTILTRFKLELAFLGNRPEVEALKEDVAEMQRMLEAYLAFARGDGGEIAEAVPLAEIIAASARVAARNPEQVRFVVPDGLTARLKPNAFRRLLDNLIGNAARFGRRVDVAAATAERQLVVTVDDDGPGIAPGQRADAFRPFVRLDNARNLDEPGTGLGLAIALDIARAHGGDLQLEDSPLGGLRARLTIPL